MDFFDDIFSFVTDTAIAIAPYAIPAGLAYGATRLLGGTSQEGLIAAGVAGATTGLMRGMGGGGGTLSQAGVANGPISGAPVGGAAGSGGGAGTSAPVSTVPGSVVQPGQSTRPGILDSLGLTGGDLLKAGGQIIGSLDDTDDEFRERELDILDRRSRVDPVSWRPTTAPRQPVGDATNRKVI